MKFIPNNDNFLKILMGNVKKNEAKPIKASIAYMNSVFPNVIGAEYFSSKCLKNCQVLSNSDQ